MWSHVCIPVKILANELQSIEQMSVISRAGYENMDGDRNDLNLDVV